MATFSEVRIHPWDLDFFGNFASSLSTYGLEQALASDKFRYGAFDYHAHGYVFMDACPATVSHGPECNASCNNTFGSMFESLSTLHNSYMSVDPSLGSSETAVKLQLLEEHKATANNVVRVLEDCLVNYCYTLPACKEDTKRPGFIYYICNNIPWRINSDVGGIGIYVSYWIQTGLARLGLIGILFWKWIFPRCHSCFQAFNHGRSAAASRSQRLNQVAQKHLSRLVAALTDFHKAQCFFMLAINIAALVVIQRGGFDPQSLQQMYNTYIFLRVLAVNGFLPITFTLTNLYLVGMLSWFLSLLSFVTIALSVATLACVGQFNPSLANMTGLAELAASGGPEECDGRKPGIYCPRIMEYNSGVGYFYGGQNVPNYAYTIFGFCLVNLALLIICQLQVGNIKIVRSAQAWINTRVIYSARLVEALLKILRRRIVICIHPTISQGARMYWKHMIDIMFSTKTPSSTWSSARTARLRNTRAWRFCTESASIVHQKVQTLSWQSLIKLAFGAAIYVVFITFYATFYNMYLHDLAWFAKNKVNGNTWNFGQVFAITVWVPPIVEYIHLELRGMHRAFDHRLLPPFRISRTPAPNPAAEIESINILPFKNEDSDLESGNRGSSASITPVTSTSANSASPSSPGDDEDIGNATTMEAYDDLDDDDIGQQDHYDESNGYHPTDQADSIIPLQSYDNGHGSSDQDTERLLPPLDFSEDGIKFSSISL